MNRWCGAGKIFHTPQLVHAGKSTQKLRLSLQTTEILDDGQEVAEFHNLAIKGPQSTHWHKTVGKGDLVAIVAKVTYHTSERGGPKRRITEMEVHEITILARHEVSP